MSLFTPYGLPVHVDPNLPLLGDPVRKLAMKPWHYAKTHCYSRRIRKKWLKRFGRLPDVHCLQTAVAIFLSPSAFEKMKAIAQ